MRLWHSLFYHLNLTKKHLFLFLISFVFFTWNLIKVNDNCTETVFKMFCKFGEYEDKISEDYDRKQEYFMLPLEEPPSTLPHTSIMFLEGFSNSFLLPRMLCSIESAANAHPINTIYVMMTSQHLRLTQPTLKVKSTYNNVKFVYLNVSKLLLNSEVEEWFLNERWKSSKWPKPHFNDILRWALLWKYGGIYLDMDVIVLKNLPQEENFSCLESNKWVGAGAVRFTRKHPLMKEALRRLNLYFDGTIWGANGPELLTHLLIEKCGMKLPSGYLTKCADIKIYPSKAFYPIPWWRWFEYKTNNEELANRLIQDPQVLGLHVWNAHLKSYRILLSESSPYSLAAKKFCPKVTSEFESF